MKVNKGKILILCSVFFFVSGCRFKKEVEISIPIDEKGTVSFNEQATNENVYDQEELYMQTLDVNFKELDLNEFAQVFLNVPSIDEAEKYKPKHNFGQYYYEANGKIIFYVKESGIVGYNDEVDGASECYNAIISAGGYFVEGLGSSLRRLCPEEELDICTRKQAIEACSEYAQACGYDDADISTYAFTLDVINKINDDYYDGKLSAPGEGFQIVTRGQIWELRDAGKDEEAEKLEDKLHSATERGLPWKKEHEAILIYYRPKLNKLCIDSMNAGLAVVYVPYTDKIVYISGNVPYEQIGISEINELTSKEKAVSQAAQVLGVRSSEDIEINQISLVYAIQYSEDDQYCAVPTWKIDYLLKNANEYTMRSDTGSIRVDAVSGFVLDYWKQE